MLTAMQLTLEDVSDALWDYRPPSKVGRHELTNAQWLLIGDLFPRPETRRGNPRHPRRLLDGMFWILRTGAPWRDLPRDRYGPWLNWLKDCRRVATRFEKLAVNYLGMIELAIIQRLLRVATS